MGLLHVHGTSELGILQTKPSPIFAIKIKEIKNILPCKKLSYVVPRCVGLSPMGEGTVKGLRSGAPRCCGEQ